MARRIFNPDSEIYKSYSEISKLRSEIDKLYSERSKLYSEIYTILENEFVIKVPDYRAFNIKAKYIKNSVFCFVWGRKELWVYDGYGCPDADTVRKINWK